MCRCGHPSWWHDEATPAQPCAKTACHCTAMQSKDSLPRGGAEGSEEPACTHCQGPHALEDCKGLEEPEEDPYRGLAGNCGTCGAKGADEEPEEGVCACGHPEGDHRAGLSHPHSGCNWCTKEQCGGYRTEADAETAPVPIPRRPPYAVAYAVEGGALYEVAVPGDATVVAEDGVLMVLHPKKPVLAIVKIQPMNMEESND